MEIWLLFVKTACALNFRPNKIKKSHGSSRGIFLYSKLESIGNKLPRANRCDLHHSRTDTKSKIPKPNNVRFRDLLVTRTGLEANQQTAESLYFKGF